MVHEGETDMSQSPSFIQEQKKKLEEEQEMLKKQLAGITMKDIEKADQTGARFPSYGEKDDDNAAEVAQYSDNLSLGETLEHSLADVEAALKRVADGTYGVCKYCGKEIEEPRLRVRPSSSSCITCKQKLKSQI